MTFFPTNSWIKGHKTIGDTIAVELPQLIYINDNDVNYYATRMNFEVVDGNNQYVKRLAFTDSQVCMAQRFAYKDRKQ